MNPKEELRRFWKSLGIVLIALALLIWTQWNMWPPPTDHTPWQEVGMSTSTFYCGFW